MDNAAILRRAVDELWNVGRLDEYMEIYTDDAPLQPQARFPDLGPTSTVCRHSDSLVVGGLAVAVAGRRPLEGPPPPSSPPKRGGARPDALVRPDAVFRLSLRRSVGQRVGPVAAGAHLAVRRGHGHG